MNAISLALGTVLALLLAPSAQAFFWSCPELSSDESVSNTTAVMEMMSSIFPAKVYLKRGEDGEMLYSCIEIAIFDDYQEPAPAQPTPESRWFLGCLFGCEEAEETPVPYNATINYFMEGKPHTAYTNISVMEKDGGLVVTLMGVPDKMFGERNGKTKLRFASIGDGYFVLIDCNNYFLSFGHTRYSYMMLTPDADVEALMEMDWRCVASGLEEVTETTGVLPGGICSA